MSLFQEFFEESGIGSMSRLISFIGAVITSAATIIALLNEEYASAINFAGILAGLSGLNYGVNRMSEAYETARIGREEITPTTAETINVTAEGDVNVEKTN